jgi:hypothetical protein
MHEYLLGHNYDTIFHSLHIIYTLHIISYTLSTPLTYLHSTPPYPTSSPYIKKITNHLFPISHIRSSHPLHQHPAIPPLPLQRPQSTTHNPVQCSSHLLSSNKLAVNHSRTLAPSHSLSNNNHFTFQVKALIALLCFALLAMLHNSLSSLTFLPPSPAGYIEEPPFPKCCPSKI